MSDPICTCKDKSGETLRILSRPFDNEDKTYVVTKDKNDVFQIKLLKNLIFEDGVPITLLDPEYVESIKSKHIDPNDYPYIVPYDKCILRETNEELIIISFPYYDDNGTIVINIRDSQNNLVMYSIGDLIFKPKISESEFSESDSTVFKSGARRSNDVDEYRFDLISPFAIRALARAYKEGADNYPIYNCEKGFPIYDLLNHVENHILEYKEGKRKNNELGKALWGLAMCIHSEAMWPYLNEGTLRKEGCLPPDNPENKYWKDLKK